MSPDITPVSPVLTYIFEKNVSMVPCEQEFWQENDRHETIIDT